MLFLTTTSSDVVVPELGITIVHPTTDFEISAQFSAEEIASATSLTTAITSGQLTWKKTAMGADELASDYDPDYVEIAELNTGTGDSQDRAIIFRNFDNVETVGTSNASGSKLAYAKADHVHNHGNQTNPSHHAAVTTADAGFMSAPDKVILNRLRTGFLQYTNSAPQSNNTNTYATITLDTDLNSFANGFFTKVSATEFRADFDGRVEINYDASISAAGNNRGALIRLLKNGGVVTGSERHNMGSSSTSHSTTSPTMIIPVVSGDLFVMQFRSSTNKLSTIPTNYAKILIKIHTLGVS